MKRKLLFAVCLIAAGILSYYGGYRIYEQSHAKAEPLEIENLQRGISFEETIEVPAKEYYIGKIEQDLLVIYKMPEAVIYDSVVVSSLDFYGGEEKELMEGKVFQDLTAVFEFLENSMS